MRMIILVRNVIMTFTHKLKIKNRTLGGKCKSKYIFYLNKLSLKTNSISKRKVNKSAFCWLVFINCIDFKLNKNPEQQMIIKIMLKYTNRLYK